MDDVCSSLFSPNISASSQEVMGPGERRQLAAARLGSRRVHGHPASGSFAQLVALELKELLHTAGQLPVEASDVEVVVDGRSRNGKCTRKPGQYNRARKPGL